MVLGVVVLLFILSVEDSHQYSEPEQIKELVTQWAPLIWIHPEEKFFPTTVESFLSNVDVSDEDGKILHSSLNETFFPNFISNKSLFLVTKRSLDSLKREESSFLNGHNPIKNSVAVYVVVTSCSPHTSFRSSDANSLQNDINMLYRKVNPKLHFTVSYWTFYPYNQGKKFCFLGKIPVINFFGRCLGHLRAIASHVGDWEHMTLLFRGHSHPSELYLAVHNFGGYYKFDVLRNYFRFNPNKVVKGVGMPKFPQTVRLQGGRPVLFSADGSHGLWSAPGEHEYLKIPRLIDKCAYGVPWKTWKNLKIYGVGTGSIPDWMRFNGKWGNPNTNCLFSKLGLCEHTEGPPGILRSKQEFDC